VLGGRQRGRRGTLESFLFTLACLHVEGGEGGRLLRQAVTCCQTCYEQGFRISSKEIEWRSKAMGGRGRIVTHSSCHSSAVLEFSMGSWFTLHKGPKGFRQCSKPGR